jgi:predicted O-methyltransferase YrrM
MTTKTASPAADGLRRLLKKAPPLPPWLKSRLAPRVFPVPVQVRHAEYSMLFSLDDSPGAPSPRLFDVTLRAVERARHIRLGHLARTPDGARWIDVWPGEHYRLLAALMETEKPRLVVEVGTAQGLSAHVMAETIPAGGKVVTYDIRSWNTFPDVHVVEADFTTGKLEQRLVDLGDPVAFAREVPFLKDVDIFFLDAAKDGALEQRLLDNLATVKFTRPPLVIFDDVRLWNMLAIWRSVARPKLDVTSFGHWSGTGIIDWTP